MQTEKSLLLTKAFVIYYVYRMIKNKHYFCLDWKEENEKFHLSKNGDLYALDKEGNKIFKEHCFDGIEDADKLKDWLITNLPETEQVMSIYLTPLKAK